jgi:small subunit ribosomal protein S21
MNQMETRVEEGESIESALKRFRRQCQRDGVLAEIKKREFYEKPSVRRKKKMLAARRRRS